MQSKNTRFNRSIFSNFQKFELSIVRKNKFKLTNILHS